jgi:hypothetical protein
MISLQGVFMRVVLFYHCMVYLRELCYSIITGFNCESCAILSLHGLFVKVITTLTNTPCTDRIEQLSQINPVMIE